jgi:hypothetical protein
MFIPKEESDRRLQSEENLVNRVSRPDSGSAAHPELLPPSIDLDVHELLSEETGELDEAALSKLLNVDEYAGRGTKSLSRETQAAIGVTAGILGTTKASRMHDVAISSAHSYERGYTGPVDLVNPAKSPKEDLADKIIAGHGIIVDKAFGRLMKTLDLLDDDKLAGVKKASDLANIGRNLSGIIAHASQSTKDNNFDNREQSVHFHIMRPDRAEESEYKTVEISSEREEKAYQERNRES